MEVFVHTEDNQILTMEFTQEDTVNSLEEKLKKRSEPIAFCYNSKILMKGFSLSFYKINSGDHIYVVSTKRRPVKKTLDKQLHRYQEESKRRVESVKNESDRIKDVIFKKVEGTSSYFRKVVRKYNKMVGDRENKEIVVEETLIPERADTPSASPLPQLW